MSSPAPSPAPSPGGSAARDASGPSAAAGTPPGGLSRAPSSGSAAASGGGTPRAPPGSPPRALPGAPPGGAPAAPAAGAAGSLAAGTPPRRVVIVGGTGRQGGAVARRLLALNDAAAAAGSPPPWAVVVLTRNAGSPEAAAVRAAGAALVVGNCKDKASLLAAFAGAAAVFGVTNPFSSRWSGIGRPTSDGATEVAQGRNIVDACAEAGVAHLVLSSAASANAGTGVPTFENKFAVEQHAAASPMARRLTVLAPVGFFENLENVHAGLRLGVVPSLLKPDRRLQLVSVEDVGAVAVAALGDPAAFCGRRIELAGDTLSANDMAAALARVRGGGEAWRVAPLPEWVLVFVPKALARLRQFLDERGTAVDLAAVRAVHPGVMDFEAWLRFRGLDKRALPKPSSCTVA